MSSSSVHRLCIFFLVLFSAASASVGSDDLPTAYEILEEYDFPVGILPKGVTSYEFNSSTGKFAVYFNKTCSFEIESYSLQYKSKITGTLSEDKLSNLSGVQVKLLFFWVNIGAVARVEDELDFTVGIISADFPIDNFYESPQCGCGFDCVNSGGKSTGKFTQLVYSS
ncbi:uncharacterized protein At5g01610-like [Nicotiana sylvestris]|uniref:Uncharacterized protein At5g01610-like n=1 Tax=Nicotiana sylvestris TaxID=4096 RepID=A0A1U7YJD9_NICSY|nr:PREDICTED: uncharacterized protein At5g01610-like [Nicotiana sylvestris]